MKNVLLILFPLIILFTGCIDDPVQQNNNTISGTAFDECGFHSSHISLTLNGIQYYNTNYTGNFIFSGVSIPYNIALGYSYYGGFDAIYLGLTNTKPQPVLRFSAFNSVCRVTVHHPRSLYYFNHFKFISEKQFVQDDWRVNQLNDTTTEIPIEIPSTEQNISGKLIYLKFDGYYYSKYGTKDLYVNALSTNEITFSAADISYDPEEINLSLSSTIPYGLNSDISEVYIDFFDGNKQGELLLDYTFYGNYNIFRVPALENISYRFRVSQNANNAQHQFSTKWVYVNPGENASITLKSCPEIILPQDNAVNITDTSAFMFEDSESPCVYKVYFETGVFLIYSFEIYTDKKKLKISDFMPGSFGIPPNTKFRWQVTRYSNYNSIDEFVSQPYTVDNRYNSVEGSKMFSFTTAQ